MCVMWPISEHQMERAISRFYFYFYILYFEQTQHFAKYKYTCKQQKCSAGTAFFRACVYVCVCEFLYLNHSKVATKFLVVGAMRATKFCSSSSFLAIYGLEKQTELIKLGTCARAQRGMQWMGEGWMEILILAHLNKIR